MAVTKETIYYPSEERIPWPDFILLPCVLLSLIEQYVNENYIEFVKTWESEHSQKIEWNCNLSKGVYFNDHINRIHNWNIMPLKCYSMYYTKTTWYWSSNTFSLSVESFHSWEKYSKKFYLDGAHKYLTPERSKLEGESKINKQINQLYEAKNHKYNYWLLYMQKYKIYIYCFKSKNAILDQLKRIEKNYILK
jgi:hypothetical protein